MAEVWFNEYGYVAKTKKGRAAYLYDLPDYVVNDARALYLFRWIVLNKAMENVVELIDKDKEELELHTDSRLVEEINGEIETDESFAKSSLLYLLTYDADKFTRVTSRKQSSRAIENKIKELS